MVEVAKQGVSAPKPRVKDYLFGALPAAYGLCALAYLGKNRIDFQSLGDVFQLIVLLAIFAGLFWLPPVRKALKTISAKRHADDQAAGMPTRD